VHGIDLAIATADCLLPKSGGAVRPRCSSYAPVLKLSRLADPSLFTHIYESGWAVQSTGLDTLPNVRGQVRLQTRVAASLTSRCRICFT
jgi:hypothetical protein